MRGPRGLAARRSSRSGRPLVLSASQTHARQQSISGVAFVVIGRHFEFGDGPEEFDTLRLGHLECADSDRAARRAVLDRLVQALGVGWRQ